MSASGSNLALPWYGLMIFTVVFVTARLPSLFTVVGICLGPEPPPHPKRSRQAKTAAALRLFISQTRK